MNILTIPQSNLEITEGTIVTLSKYPQIKWILRYGSYSYRNSNTTGWYLSSIPNETILPLNYDDLNSITIVSDDFNCCEPCDLVEPEVMFTLDHDYMLNKSTMCVDTPDERDRLILSTDLPHGKLVRVASDYDNQTRYYTWNKYSGCWVEENFAMLGEEDNSYSKPEIDQLFYTTNEQLNELQESKVDNVPGMQLTEVNFSQDYENKLNSVEFSAQQNRIESITINGQQFTIDGDKSATITLFMSAFDGYNDRHYVVFDEMSYHLSLKADALALDTANNTIELLQNKINLLESNIMDLTNRLNGLESEVSGVSSLVDDINGEVI